MKNNYGLFGGIIAGEKIWLNKRKKEYLYLAVKMIKT